MSKKKLSELIRLPARASVWYLISSALAKGISVIATPFFTRLQSGEDYGQFVLYMTLLGGASIICSAFSQGSGFYRGLQEKEDRQGEFLKTIFGVEIAISVIICLLLFAFSPFLEIKNRLLVFLLIQLLCDGITAILLSYHRFYYNYKIVSTVSLLSAILPPLISVFLLFRFRAGYILRIYSLLSVSVFIAVFSVIWLIKKQDKTVVKKGIYNSVREVISFSAPMLPHAISNAITLQADKLIINGVMGTSALGKYSVIYSMGILLQFAVTAIGSALSPWIVRRLEAGEMEKISRLVLPMTLGYSALSLCVIAIAPEALSILAPKEYFDAFPALMPIALSTPFYFLSWVATTGLVYSGKTKYSLIISFVGAGSCIILNYTLINAFGYLGAGLAFLVFQVLTAILSIALLTRTGLNKMINRRRTAKALLLSLPIGVVISAFSASLFGRVVMLIFPLAILLYCLKMLWPQIAEKGRKICS